MLSIFIYNEHNALGYDSTQEVEGQLFEFGFYHKSLLVSNFID